MLKKVTTITYKVISNQNSYSIIDFGTFLKTYTIIK